MENLPGIVILTSRSPTLSTMQKEAQRPGILTEYSLTTSTLPHVKPVSIPLNTPAETGMAREILSYS
jgi:hypothetical protein